MEQEPQQASEKQRLELRIGTLRDQHEEAIARGENERAERLYADLMAAQTDLNVLKSKK